MRARPARAIVRRVHSLSTNRRGWLTTTDLRALFKAVLHDHLEVARAAIDATVLPGTAAVRPLDLLRA